ncbi:MAG: polysaccharide deacetylase family protein [Peptococcia bacterium]
MKVFLISRRSLNIAIGIICVLLLMVSLLKIVWPQADPVVNPIYYGDTNQQAVALMINVDWGEKVLPEMLDILKSKEVKATFFITGRFADKFPELVQRISQEGHEIGNHGYSHPHVDKLSVADNEKEISRTEEEFNKLEINYSKIFAPPYGEHKEQVLEAAANLGYKTIMWTADTIDWQDPPPETIVKRVLGKADNGALVLMHPKECTLSALPAVIDGLQAREFQLKKVTEILP